MAAVYLEGDVKAHELIVLKGMGLDLSVDGMILVSGSELGSECQSFCREMGISAIVCEDKAKLVEKIANLM